MRQVAFSPERMLARQQLIQENSERKDIGGGGDGLSPNLFRAAVFRSQDDGGGRGVGGQILRLFNQLGNSEVEKLHRTGAGYQHISRLQIAMHCEIAMR